MKQQKYLLRAAEGEGLRRCSELLGFSSLGPLALGFGGWWCSRFRVGEFPCFHCQNLHPYESKNPQSS